jgi:hypothetical protein
MNFQSQFLDQFGTVKAKPDHVVERNMNSLEVSQISVGSKKSQKYLIL